MQVTMVRICGGCATLVGKSIVGYPIILITSKYGYYGSKRGFTAAV